MSLNGNHQGKYSFLPLKTRWTKNRKFQRNFLTNFHSENWHLSNCRGTRQSTSFSLFLFLETWRDTNPSILGLWVDGATTLSITTFSRTTLSKTILSTTTVSKMTVIITTVSIMTVSTMTVSITTVSTGDTKEGSIAVQLTSCVTCSD